MYFHALTQQLTYIIIAISGFLQFSHKQVYVLSCGADIHQTLEVRHVLSGACLVKSLKHIHLLPHHLTHAQDNTDKRGLREGGMGMSDAVCIYVIVSLVLSLVGLLFLFILLGVLRGE